MATKEQIDTLFRELEKAPPSEHFKYFDESTAGIQAILKYLNTTEKEASAGKISNHIKVSTARTAVLLKKMEAKNLIERKPDPDDGRMVIVKLSEHGKQKASAIHENVCRSLGEMIDKVGMDRMLEFVEISNEIHKLMNNTDIGV